MMPYNYLNTSELNLFCELSKREVTDYLLDYVAREYESVINCPAKQTKSKPPTVNYRRMSNVYPTTRSYTSLPSPPLTSSEYNNMQQRELKMNSRPITPPLPQTNKASSLNHKTPPMSLRYFIEVVMKKSKMDTGTLLLSLAYARRLRLKLYHTSKGMECTHHRIFVATLMIASKYIHDASIKNKYWVEYSLNLFSRTEVNLMEKQLLQLLDYKLEIPIKDFELIANDIVQLHMDQFTCSPITPYDSAYSSNSSSKRNSCQYNSDSTPILNQFKPSPPLLHLHNL